MIISRKLTLSENQTIRATGAVLSTDVLAWPPTAVPPGESAAFPRDMGSVEPGPVFIQVTEDFNNATSVLVELITAATGDMAGATVLASAQATLAQLKAGFRFPLLTMPAGAMNTFFAARYTVTGTAPTTGRITATLGTGDV